MDKALQRHEVKMYKDKEKQRETTRERVRRYRGKGVTSSTVDRALQGKALPGKILTLEVAKEISASTPAVEGYNFKVPERAKVLPAEVIKGILAVLHSRATASLCQDDSDARWDRAITYHNWKLAYKPVKLDKPALWF